MIFYWLDLYTHHINTVISLYTDTPSGGHLSVTSSYSVGCFEVCVCLCVNIAYHSRAASSLSHFLFQISCCIRCFIRHIWKVKGLVYIL